MSYTTTITWATEELTPGGDTYQLIMTFTHDDTGSNRSWAAADYDLVILDHGRVLWEYEIQDAFLTPSTVELEISDPNGTLDDLFFGQDAINVLVNKQPKIEIKINGTTDFIGYAIEDTIDNDPAEHRVKFIAAPRIDIIKKQMLFKDDEVPIDPFDYVYTDTAVNITNAVYANGEVTVTHDYHVSLSNGDYVKISGVTGMTDLNGVFEIHNCFVNIQFKVYLYTEQTYISGGTIKEVVTGSTQNIIDMLVDIYQLVNSGLGSVDLDLNQDWDFDAGLPTTKKALSNAVHSGGQVTITHASMTALDPGDQAAITEVGGMTDLNGELTVISGTSTTTTVELTTAQSYTSGGYIKEYLPCDFENIKLKIDPYFYNTNAGFITTGDILKNLALTFFCYTGMIHEDKPFFRKLFYYDTGNLQTLGTVYKFIKRYKYSLLDYVKAQSIDFDIPFAADEQIVAEAGTFTEMDGKSLILENIPVWAYTLDLGWNLSDEYFSSITDDLDVGIYFIRDTAIDNDWHSNVYLIANLWYNFRNNIQNTRVDYFEVEGIDYDFLKCFPYDGYKYQIIMMEKDYKKNLTKIEALFLGAV